MFAPLALLTCLAAGSARPTLSGPEIVYDSLDGRLRLHYTLEGPDALANADDVDPANGVPDTLDWVIEGIDRVHQAFVVGDGWAAPVPDEGAGGDDRLDIYIRDIDRNGYAHTERTPSGATTSYVEIDPYNARFLNKETFESIAGHEYHHVLQFAMTTAAATWIYEATATYAQYVLFDDQFIDYLVDTLWLIRIRNPERALSAVGDPYQYEYAGMLWAKFLVDSGGGDRTLLRDLWQAMADEGGWVAGHDRFARERLGLDGLDAAAAEFAVWNWFACGNDDGHHYDAATIPCRLTLTVPAEELGTLPASVTSGTIGSRGSRYVTFPASEALRVTIRPTQRMRLGVVEGSAVRTIEAAAGADTTFDVGAPAALVATNVGPDDATLHLEAVGNGGCNVGGASSGWPIALFFVLVLRRFRFK